jgi:hypothetical protein
MSIHAVHALFLLPPYIVLLMPRDAQLFRHMCFFMASFQQTTSCIDAQLNNLHLRVCCIESQAKVAVLLFWLNKKPRSFVNLQRVIRFTQ